MADRSDFKIIIGGKLPDTLIAEMHAIINEYDLREHWNGQTIT